MTEAGPVTRGETGSDLRRKPQPDVRVDVHHGAMDDLAVEVGYDHRHLPRRRGEVLAKAIGEAVVAELAERGYSALTFEGVASRAGTGKSTLYRRWADKPTMVVDCLAAQLPSPQDHDLNGDLRADLITVLSAYAEACGGTVGVALRAICGEAVKNCDQLQQLWRERVSAPKLALIRNVLEQAVAKGQARPGAIEDECVMAGPAMVGQIYMANDRPPTREEVVRIVDHVMVPMLEARRAT